MLIADEIDFYVDASGVIGFGGYSDRDWMQYRWSEDFLRKCSPSIEFLELYAMAAGILAWIHKYANRRVILFTDNDSVKAMLNNNSANCRNCMILIRLIVLHSLVHNVRFYARHVRSESNEIADSLSRFQNSRFKRLTRRKNMSKTATPVPDAIWPVEKIWLFK